MKVLITTILFFTTMVTLHANDSISLKYLVREPQIKSQKTPAIILLHGVGSNEQDLFSFANKLPNKYLVIAARAPFMLGNNSFAWYQVDFSTGKPVYNMEQEKISRKLIVNFIEQLKVKYNLDTNEIYLCGFSQGAIMSYSVALTAPSLVKGIAVMSGRLLDEIKPQIAPAKLQKLRIFIAHGQNDNTLPIHYAIDATAYLKTLNINAELKEYHAGHEINGEMLNELINWLK